MVHPKRGGLSRLADQSLADQAKEQIRQAIFEGSIKPDEHLTIERIAEELGISRTPVREALKALEADGLIAIRPHRGAVVQKLSKEQVKDLYQVRALLEGHAGVLACEVEDLESLVELLSKNCRLFNERIRQEGTEELEDAKALLQLNKEFHSAIHTASASSTLQRLIGSLNMPLSYSLYYWRSRERQKITLDFHLQIVDALKKRNSDAVKAVLEQHILEARDFLVSIG